MGMVGAGIGAWRDRQGLTQAALARAADIPRPNLVAIEGGRRDLTVGTLLRIAAALGVPPGQLFSAPPPAAPPDRHALDAVARAVVTGVRGRDADRDRLADDVAAYLKPLLDAAGAPGARRARGLRRARAAERRWGREILEAVQARVVKHLAAPLAPPKAATPPLPAA